MAGNGWAPRLGDFVANNEAVNGVDKILRTCLWLIPDRFSRRELAVEACTSVIGLMRVGVDGIGKWQRAEPGAAWITALKFLEQIEVLYEMQANHLEVLGKCSKYTPLAALELVKLFVRLALLNALRRPVATTMAPIPHDQGSRKSYAMIRAFKRISEQRSDESSSSRSEPAEDPADGNGSEGFQREGQLWWERRTRARTECEDCVVDEVCPDSSEFCYKAGRTMLLIGELLYLIRPVICVFALRKYGPRSLKLWMISLGMDVCSQALLTKGESIMKYAGVKRPKNPNIQDHLLGYLTMVRNFQWTPVEQKEMRRRKMMFLVYLLRSPIFEAFTKPGLDSTQKVVSRVPVLSEVLGKAIELLYGVQRYHVYTSGNW